ncbi:alanine or glycine:cation symporter, AGCS family [Methylomarinovum tepidoasis]|uniref:Alanine or glycine:cation symporter, AGCS family n=1 Tax=Methylomarinovum tepidoasis TaxID=2840183 RepID=A0AAU9CBP2_9GAMM|nr:sodium:alanine symporter family protein [Methylomarinovum sp. IN45]BCX87653.1 alanine or glycine:cation symporter, AGCS family [Methylomarinovum sp. IN45]
MEAVAVFESWMERISGVVWGPVTLALLLGTGIYLTVGLRFLPWRRLGHALILLWQGRKGGGGGEITPFQALMTALSATIGTGNIAGVATAIALGGPGAVLWMWLTALFGMATKYAEAVLAVRYRERDALGQWVGGPMYYIKNGLGKRWRWLGWLFALFGTVAAFGIGNMVQANSVADALDSTWRVSHGWSGGVLMLLTAAVVLGGIRRIAEVASALVPLMAISYLAAAGSILYLHRHELGDALGTIVFSAFDPRAAAGGVTGGIVWNAVRFGVARGVFSNEAGLGSAPIAHAAARTTDPVRQGLVAMLGTFIDTLVICTLTALVILVSGLWDGGANGAALSTAAFEAGLSGYGAYVVSLGLAVFAFTTILGWSYYGERCAEFLFGVRAILPYRLLWIAAVPLGALGKLTVIWLVADVMNAMMALPNLIALLLLSPVVFRLSLSHAAKR